MSQSPSTAQPNFHAQVLFHQRRLEVLKLRGYLSEVRGEDSAAEWVGQFVTGMVRGGLFLSELTLTFL